MEINLPWKNLLRQNNWKGLFCGLFFRGIINANVILLQDDLFHNTGNYYAAKKFRGRIIGKAYSAAIFHLTAE